MVRGRSFENTSMTALIHPPPIILVIVQPTAFTFAHAINNNEINKVDGCIELSIWILVTLLSSWFLDYFHSFHVLLSHFTAAI